MISNFEWSWNLPELILQIISCVLIISLLLIIYKKQSEKPHMGKAVLAAMVGIFSFSINFQFQGHSVSLAILPLGVGILYFFIKRRNEDRWLVYRRYAWVGFLANYVFLLTGLHTPLVFNLMYDKSDPSTYLANTVDAEVHLTHESADQRNLHNERLEMEMENAQVKEFDSMRWHREIEDREEKERFPYILSRFESKSGSNLKAVTFVEKDGKGLLIQTAEDQLYVRTEQSVLKEGE
ncbi:hypothetical protein [Halobacillus sp. B23F22_1]|uniref:hypothetical protein n=1 Tax=Halobacillus sp. B23F22_1 TaxID=3459514 RepID=UPI00373E0A6D